MLEVSTKVPKVNPPKTSVSQCKFRYSLVKAIKKIMKMDKLIEAIFRFLDLSFLKIKYIKSPKKTTAFVVCPLGNAKLLLIKRAFEGLALWTSSFNTKTIAAFRIIVIAKNKDSFLECVNQIKADKIKETKIINSVSKIKSIIFEILAKKLFWSEGIKELTIKSNFGKILRYDKPTRIKIKTNKEIIFKIANFLDMTIF